MFRTDVSVEGGAAGITPFTILLLLSFGGTVPAAVRSVFQETTVSAQLGLVAAFLLSLVAATFCSVLGATVFSLLFTAFLF